MKGDLGAYWNISTESTQQMRLEARAHSHGAPGYQLNGSKAKCKDSAVCPYGFPREDSKEGEYLHLAISYCP